MNAMNDGPFPSHSQPLRQGSETVTDEFSDMLGTLWRGSVWLLIAVLLGAFAGLYHALGVSDQRYRATTTLVMDGGPDPVVQFSDFLPTMAGDQTIINTELEILRSASLLRDIVVSELLVQDPEFNPALRAPGLWIRAVDHVTHLFRLPAFGHSNLARDIHETNITIETLRQSLIVRNIPDSMVFEVTFETRSPEKSARLANLLVNRYLERQLETKFEATQRATEWLANKVAELEVELESSEAAMNAFSAQMELINAETLDILTAELIDVRDRIDAREAAISRGESTARTVTIVAQLHTLEAELSDKITHQSQDLMVLEQLQREAAADRQIYEYFLSRFKETSVQEGIQQADARLLSAAMVPSMPSTPRPMLSAALSAVLALIGAAAFLILAESRTATFRTADQLEEATGLPVLGQIPQMATRRRQGVLDYIRKNQNSAAVEAIRNLRTSLLMSGAPQGPKVILSTSSLPGEGKTTQTLALAQNMTGVKRRVLVIEGDIRKRVFREYFKAPNAGDIMQVLFGKQTLEEAVWHNSQLGFDILFGADTAGNAADIFSTERFRRLLQQARREYDVILIDTPPVLLVPDARVIAQHADAVLYTVRWDKTREKQVSQGLKAFHSVGVSVTGMVLSQINPRGLRRYGYGKDYGTSEYYKS